jgi:hypothetical protein
MADGRPRRFALQVHLDYTFDRLRAPKLAQVYELLVPLQQRLVGASVRKEVVHEVAVIYARVPVGFYRGPARPGLIAVATELCDIRTDGQY